MASKVPTFDEFWHDYPLHRGRKEAQRAWNRLTAENKRLALAAIPAYITDCQKHGTMYKYAQGWLNGQRWEDNLTEDVSAAKKSDAILPLQPDAAQPVRDANGNRIGCGISDAEREAFKMLKDDLLKVWSRHCDERNGPALRDLLDGLELYGINDDKRMIYIHSRRQTFNRRFTVPFFWDVGDFDALVFRRFNAYQWNSY